MAVFREVFDLEEVPPRNGARRNKESADGDEKFHHSMQIDRSPWNCCWKEKQQENTNKHGEPTAQLSLPAQAAFGKTLPFRLFRIHVHI